MRSRATCLARMRESPRQIATCYILYVLEIESELVRSRCGFLHRRFSANVIQSQHILEYVWPSCAPAVSFNRALHPIRAWAIYSQAITASCLSPLFQSRAARHLRLGDIQPSDTAKRYTASCLSPLLNFFLFCRCVNSLPSAVYVYSQRPIAN